MLSLYGLFGCFGLFICQTIFKGFLGLGMDPGSFLFLFIFSFNFSALDHSATAYPIICHTLPNCKTAWPSINMFWWLICRCLKLPKRTMLGTTCLNGITNIFLKLLSSLKIYWSCSWQPLESFRMSQLLFFELLRAEAK